MSAPTSLILVVEDNEVNQLLTASVLEREGFEVDVVGSSAQAIEQLANRKPDLILMDIQLPILDGYETTRQIKADPDLKAIPIIAVISFAMKGDEDKARASGCDHYVTKPYSPLQLLRIIRGFLGEKV